MNISGILKYTLVNNQNNHKWITKSGDKHYNTLIEDRAGKYGPKECEVLPGNNRAYQQYVIVIDHNTNPVIDGRGSAIFIHKSTREKGTLGCVAVRGTNSDAIMKQLTECNLINVRKDGKMSYYSLNKDTLNEYLEFFNEIK